MRVMKIKPLSPGEAPELDDAAAAAPDGLPEGKELKRELKALRRRMEELGNALAAERRRVLLVVLQSRDAAGKDGVVRKVFSAFLPQQLHVVGFQKPKGEEEEHDYLWRVHNQVPRFGKLGVFNRSHYEEVVAVRVREEMDDDVLRMRFRQINDWERMLTENGTQLLKIFLHVSRDEQKRRLAERLDDPDQQWEFDESDLDDREKWDDYTVAFRDSMARCGTEWAPWHVVPADDKDARNLLVARLVLDALERMDPQFPDADYDVDAARRRLEEAD